MNVVGGVGIHPNLLGVLTYFGKDVCSLQHPVTVSTSLGAGSIAWTFYGTAVPCMVQPRQIQYRTTAVIDQVELLNTWIIMLFEDVDVHTGDRVIINTDAYEVVGSRRNSTYRVPVALETLRLE